MRHTIAICTIGRPETLRDTLSVLAQSLAPRRAGSTEVLVVSSGPGAAPAAIESLVASAFQGSEASAHALHEPTLGVARARNVALAHATGDILTFIDDDVRPCGRSWQEAILTTFARRPDIGLLTGPITCVVPPSVAPHPWWRSPQTDALLSCSPRWPSASCDPSRVWTANASYRISATVGLRFPEALGWGAAGHIRVGGEEVWFNNRVADRGWVAWYEAGAAVDHHVGADRFRAFWLLSRAVTEGRTAAVLRAAEGADPAAARLRASGGLVLAAARAIGNVICLQPRDAFGRCLDAALRLGVVTFPLSNLRRVVDRLSLDGARERSAAGREEPQPDGRPSPSGTSA